MNKKQNIPKYAGPESCSKNNKMSKKEIQERFDNESAYLYSQRKPLWLPEFEYVFAFVTEAVKKYIQPNSKILDLGAGTGNFSRNILEAYPKVQMTLVDFSANMLKEIDNALAHFKGRYDAINDDIFEMEFGKNKYNNIISSFAIHHARGTNEYKKLYKRIYQAILAPGIFVCCDVIEGNNAYLSKINEAGWQKYLVKQNFSNEDVDKILSNYHREDSPLSCFEHLNLLKEVGFSSVDILWKKYNFGVYVGIKE